MFVVLFSIQIIFFLYHVVLSNPGSVTTTVVIPLAVKVSGKLGEGMEAAAWWLVYGHRQSFVARSVLILSVVDPTRLSAGATSSDGTIAADIVGSPVLLPVNYLLSDVHEKVHPESELQKKAESEPALKAAHVLLNYLLSDVHGIVHPESELNQPKSGFEPEKEVVAERAVVVVAKATVRQG